MIRVPLFGAFADSILNHSDSSISGLVGLNDSYCKYSSDCWYASKESYSVISVSPCCCVFISMISGSQRLLISTPFDAQSRYIGVFSRVSSSSILLV